MFNVMDLMKEAMAADSDWAWSWHCNLTMMIKDAGCDDMQKASLASAEFMLRVFGVNVTKFIQWSYRETLQVQA